MPHPILDNGTMTSYVDKLFSLPAIELAMILWAFTFTLCASWQAWNKLTAGKDAPDLVCAIGGFSMLASPIFLFACRC